MACCLMKPNLPNLIVVNWSLETNFGEILIVIEIFSMTEMRLKMATILFRGGVLFLTLNIF